jgi:hypothetical protein
MAAAIAILRAAAPEGQPQPLLEEVIRDYDPVDVVKGFYFVSEALIQWVSALSGQDRDALLKSMGQQTAMMDDAD